MEKLWAGMVVAALLAGCIQMPQAPCPEVECVIATGLSEELGPLIESKDRVGFLTAGNRFLYWLTSEGDVTQSTVRALEWETGRITPVLQEPGHIPHGIRVHGDDAWFLVRETETGAANVTYKWTASGGLQVQAWAPRDGILAEVGAGWAAFELRAQQRVVFYDTGAGIPIFVMSTNPEDPDGYISGLAELEGQPVVALHNPEIPMTRVFQLDPWLGYLGFMFVTDQPLHDGLSVSTGAMTFLYGDEVAAMDLATGDTFTLDDPEWPTSWADEVGRGVLYLQEHNWTAKSGGDETRLSHIDLATGDRKDWEVPQRGQWTGGLSVRHRAVFVAMGGDSGPSTIFGLQLPPLAGHDCIFVPYGTLGCPPPVEPRATCERGRSLDVRGEFTVCIPPGWQVDFQSPDVHLRMFNATSASRNETYPFIAFSLAKEEWNNLTSPELGDQMVYILEEKARRDGRNFKLISSAPSIVARHEAWKIEGRFEGPRPGYTAVWGCARDKTVLLVSYQDPQAPGNDMEAFLDSLLSTVRFTKNPC